MGISFSHCDRDADSSYSCFHRFRSRLAREIGIDLDAMVGFGGIASWSIHNDPLIPFLNHDDNCGSLEPEVCATVAPRLEEVVSGWPRYDTDKERAFEIARGMRKAAERGERFRFL